ncbi:MAG: Squalene/phytoene synthase [Bacteroidetes bacterium ADurb.Bin416]|nr:MAG: Squalene/phytoene synthase [Bacteroidetes bacterium ADurb.Bin416]
MTTQETALALFETIDFNAIKDHPNILIAANFWDEERYQAAKTCYTLMRAVDDLVDNFKTEHPVLTESDRDELMEGVNTWVSRLLDGAKTGGEHQAIVETFERFKIPLWPMRSFARSMVYDIMHDGFPTLKDFLDYSKGASVAPASIFVHLCGLRIKHGSYLKPAFDVRAAATPCALFSYLVHIIRDFRKDTFNNLTYLADDILAREGLSRNDLPAIASSDTVPESFRRVIRTYYHEAGRYKEETLSMIQTVYPRLEPRYRLSLSIVFALYDMVYKRIDPDRGTFSTEELNPTPGEIKNVVYQTILHYKDEFIC